MKHEDNYKYGRFYLKINGKQDENSRNKKIKNKKNKNKKIIIIKKQTKIIINKKKTQKRKTILNSLSLLHFQLQTFKVDFHRSKPEVYI